MPALRPGTYIPTDAEDAVIRAGIALDPDARELTEADVPFMCVGRSFAEKPKKKITILLSPDTVDAFRSTGTGWQSRIDQALKQYLQDHPI